jgi:site-specific recombinase XerC
MLFDRLVTGQVMLVNPAHSVRGPKHITKRGSTPVLSVEETLALIDLIKVDNIVGLRDRALIGVMVYSFARVGAVIGMRVKDYYLQGERCVVSRSPKPGAKGNAFTRRAASATTCRRTTRPPVLGGEWSVLSGRH